MTKSELLILDQQVVMAKRMPMANNHTIVRVEASLFWYAILARQYL
jgi:hypothetical protein